MHCRKVTNIMNPCFASKPLSAQQQSFREGSLPLIGRSAKGWRLKQHGKAVTVLAGLKGDSLSEDSKAESKLHWSSKIVGGSARDDLRYMDPKALEEQAQGLPWAVKSVLRDRDNVVFVGDEALVVPFLAKEMQCEEAEAAQHLQRLVAVLPGLLEEKGRLARVGVSRLAVLCNDLGGLVSRLLELKDIFADCDLSAMVCTNPFMLTEDMADIRDSMEVLQEIFHFAGQNGTPGVDRMVQAAPQLLDSSFTKAALAELQRLYGDSAAELVHRNPKLILQVESSSLRSKYSVSFDQTHVRANKVVPMSERVDEAYYRK